jgi:2-dehydro-3-deoxyphosphogalactonate aldolase
VNDVDKVRAAGGRFIVSPNTNPAVISHTAGLGMFPIPGVATCTECFQAIDAGAAALKIFPASVVGIRGVKDLMAVIPKEVDLFAVGGVSETNLGEWLEIGVKGVGLGSHLYSAGDSPGETARKAGVMIARMNACRMS